jgi:hypothetical protein
MKKETLKNNFFHVNFKTENYSVREETHQNKKYIVLPVTMMVEGVHSGSLGPLFHSIEELGRFPQSWDGIPVVINHPQDAEGHFISANSPGVIDTVTVGRIYNTHVDGNKLVAEAWLEPVALTQVSSTTMEKINKKELVEVSVGVFTEQEDVAGQWNGESYTAIAHNHRPDHLALLPGDVGACSIEDGCGMGINSKNEKKGEKNVMEKENSQMFDAIKLLNNSGFSIHKMNVYEDGYTIIMDAVRRKIDSIDDQSTYHYVEEVYDNYVIYVARQKDGGGAKMYRQSYQIVDDVVEFIGEPVEVIKKVDIQYVPNTLKRTKFNNNKNTEVKMDNNKPPCGQCMEKIVALINNKATKFTEADREWLLTQEESMLDKLMPVTEEVTKPVVNAEPKKLTSEEVINALSAEDKAAFEFGKRQLRERRNTMIQGIQANTSKEIWPDAELAKTDDAMLERIYNSVKKEPVVDYSLNAFGGQPVEANSSMPAIEIPVGV